jgi:glycerol-3-phosphate dehydrogenase (NAD(P)+)
MNFCVVGAGAWGTAFALHLERCSRAVTLVPRRLEQAAAISSARENREYLPGIAIPRAVSVAASL